MTQRYKIRSPVVIHETIGDESVIVNLETGMYYSTSASGARIWQALEYGPAASGEIVDILRTSYLVADDSIEDRVESFLNELESEGLIVPSSAGESSDVSYQPAEGRLSNTFETPTLDRFGDMQELILLDPVHEIDPEQGWPHAEPVR